MDDEMRRLCEEYARLSVVAHIEDLLKTKDKYNALKSTYSDLEQIKIEEYYKSCEAELRPFLPKEAQLITPQIIME